MALIFEHFGELPSTNTYLKTVAAQKPDLTLAYTDNQTGGRGQRGNSWEAQPGMNLTLSLLKKYPAMPAKRQFDMSRTVALGVVDLLAEFGIAASIKWPNDIYVGDKKIAGILIEHAVTGTNLSLSVIGIGLNVNQKIFLSDAPNPTSMATEAGMEFPLTEVLERLGAILERRLEHLPGDPSGLRADFMSKLWRGKGSWPYRDAETGENFMAEIMDVGELGHLHLRDSLGSERVYAFKEVAFVL